MGTREDTIQVGTVFKLPDGRMRVVVRDGGVFESPEESKDWPTIEIFYDRGTVTFQRGGDEEP